MQNSVVHYVHTASIHVHMPVYPHVEIGYALWVIAQNFVKLRATAQNFVMHNGPQNRMIDHSAEPQEFHLKTCHNLERNQ